MIFCIKFANWSNSKVEIINDPIDVLGEAFHSACFIGKGSIEWSQSHTFNKEKHNSCCRRIGKYEFLFSTKKSNPYWSCCHNVKLTEYEVQDILE